MSTRTAVSIINSNRRYTYIDKDPVRGGVKDVYFDPNKSYAVAIYRNKQDDNAIQRLTKICTEYHDSFFNREGGDYYKTLYSWPTDVVRVEDKIGIVLPFFPQNFFFKKGYATNEILKGKEKEGKWFASAKNRVKTARLKLDPSELGNWLSYFQVAVNISRGVKRLHAAGLAHSDLSYKNVLIDPSTGRANIIDIDGLVVPRLYPPEVIGTADFIAPEVVATKHLPLDDPNRKLPNRHTDLHALAVLIYMYLLYRHPLRGGNYFGQIEPEEEETLAMGEKALFVEHPEDDSNRNFKREYGDFEKLFPWTDLNGTPYSVTGPYLTEMFNKAFIEGLHEPKLRPSAAMWEEALIKTTDLKLKCSNSKCDQQWFIYTKEDDTRCPFCNTGYTNTIPVLDFQFKNHNGEWKSDNLKMVICNNTTLHKWHTQRNIIRNERITDADKIRLGYFTFHGGKWLFVNERLTSMKDITNNKPIQPSETIELKEGNQLLFSSDGNARRAKISITNQ